MVYDPKYGNITPDQQLGYAMGEGIGAAVGDFVDGVRNLRAEEARRARAKQKRQQNMKEAIAQYKVVIERHKAYIANLEKLSNDNALLAGAFHRTAYKLGKQMGLTEEEIDNDFREQLPGMKETLEEHLRKYDTRIARVGI